MKKIYLLIILATNLIAQPDTLWTRTFGGNAQDIGYSVQQTSNGGIIITGSTSSFGNGGIDVWLIKTDANGNEEWNQTFGGIGNDNGKSVQETSDGGYIIAGTTRSFGGGQDDVWLIKTDANGNEEWNQTFGGIGNDNGNSVQQTMDNGFIITGSTSSYGNGGIDVWLIKTDSQGNEEWNQTFGGSYQEYGHSVLQTADTGFIIAGTTYSYGNGGGDIWLLRVRSPGCTDELAINYDPDTVIDDGSCYYLSDIETYFSPIWSGFPISPMVIYIQSAIFDGLDLRIGDEIGVFDGDFCVGSVQLISEIDGSVEIYVSKDNPDTPEIDGYTLGNTILYRFWDASNQTEVFNVSSIVNSGLNIFTPTGFSNVDLIVITVLGCPYPIALNYLPDATVDDGSCIFPVYGCMDEEACNYDPEANVDGDCVYFDCAGDCDGLAYEDECGVCDEQPENDNLCVGCSDPWAVNYLPIYTIDDGSCEYPDIGDISMDGIINVVDIVILVDVILNGDDYIFYMDLNNDDHINIVDIVILVDIILHPELFGCTDPFAPNFDYLAVYDDNSCATVTDIDGNSYRIIIIGNQEWIAENLKVTHYRNGDPINTEYSGWDWTDLSTGAYAGYEDDPENVETFGNLYNWYAVDDTRDICPEGWHVPTDDEFQELVDYFGGDVIAGGPLKDTGTIEGNDGIWYNPNSGATNESSFTALPGGQRDNSGGNYHFINYYGYFWSSTANIDYDAWARVLNNNDSGVNHWNANKRVGLSVRCAGD